MVKACLCCGFPAINWKSCNKLDYASDEKTPTLLFRFLNGPSQWSVLRLVPSSGRNLTLGTAFSIPHLPVKTGTLLQGVHLLSFNVSFLPWGWWCTSNHEQTWFTWTSWVFWCIICTSLHLWWVLAAVVRPLDGTTWARLCSQTCTN